jgi:hypothetical protein
MEMISFNSETCLAPDEQIIKYGLNFLPRNCRYCALRDFLKFFPYVYVYVCVCVDYFYVLSFKFPRTHNCPLGLDRANEQATKKSIVQSPQMICKTAIELHAVLRAAPPCW